MKNKSISIMHTKRFQSIFNRYSIFCSTLTLLPALLLLSVPVIIIFKIFWILILICFLLMTFFLPLLNEDFKNMLQNFTSDDTSMEVVKNVLIATYYLPLILIIFSGVFTIVSVIVSICNRKYTNSKSGLIGAIVMFIIALIFCIFYYSCFDMFIGGNN